MIDTTTTYVVLTLFGLTLGSFINVVIVRLPRGDSFIANRSHCPHCDTTLRWYDLIPVISYLILGGRCRNCKHHISLQYPMIEIAVAGLLIATYVVFTPQGIVLWIYLLSVALIFFMLAVIDAQHYILPDSLHVALLGISIVYSIVTPASPYAPWIVQHLVTAVIVSGFFYAIWWFSKGTWIGFGDIKLVGVIGLIFGFPGALIILYGAVIIGLGVALPLLVFRKAHMKTKLPLGTFLGAMAVLYIFLQDWFIHLVDTLLPMV